MSRSPRRIADAARLSQAELPPLAPDSELWLGNSLALAGADVYVRHTPSLIEGAEPALLVHGLGGSSLNWTDFAGQIRACVDVVAIDLPGFGRSGPAVGHNYSLAAQAGTVVTYLARADLGPVHLVGNSMGGAIACLVAAQHPDLVKTLTLISPAVPDVKVRAHPLKRDPRLALAMLPGVGELGLRKMAELPARTRIRGTIAVCFADPSRYPQRRLEQDVAEARARLALPWVSRAMLKATRSLAATQFLHGRTFWKQLRSITVPTLVLWGDSDALVAPDLADYVAAEIADSRLLVLKNVGHTAMMEDPVTCARAFVGLLEDIHSDLPA